jgi:hypothetical protein
MLHDPGPAVEKAVSGFATHGRALCNVDEGEKFTLEVVAM